MVISFLTEATSTNVDMPAANVFKTKISCDIAYETINDVKLSRVVQPNFSLGGFDFHFFVQTRQDKKRPFALLMALSEASKKPLLHGYNFKFTTFSLNRVDEAGKQSNWTAPKPICVGQNAKHVYGFNSESHWDVELVMETEDVFPYRNEFRDAELAAKNRSNCKIVLVDDKNKKVYVNKDILALRSPFFNTMFFGDFKEKDQDVVTLSHVAEKAFLEYLVCVYPPPNRPFAYKRLETLLILADRFQNDQLISSIKKFMAEKKDKTCDEKGQTLILSDAYNMPALFRATLQTMDKTELKAVTPKKCTEFKKENAELFITRIYDLL